MIQTACPPADTLAAFAELNLEGSERDQVLRHLEGCDDCYRTFVETARLLRPEGFEERATKRERVRVMPWLVPLAAAAALVIAVGTPGLWRLAPAGSPGAEGQPAAGVSASISPAALPAPAVLGAEPAWLRNAPWSELSRTRLGFGPASGRRRSFLLGMHLAALERACVSTAGERPAIVGQVAASVRVADLMPAGDVQRAASRAEAGECRVEPPTDAAERNGQALGRHLEDWRIAAVLGEPSAVAAERGRQARALLAKVDLEGNVRQAALRLVPAPGQGGPSLEESLRELIELLCA